MKIEVTGEVIKRANEIFGYHEVDDSFSLSVFRSSIQYRKWPHIYGCHAELQSPINSQEGWPGGYLDTSSGLLVVSNPLVVIDWFEDCELPPESPFNLARNEAGEINPLGLSARALAAARTL